MLEQLRLGAAPLAAAKQRQAAFEIVVQIALHRAQRDAGKLGDLLVRKVVALQPQHFHLPLDVRVRVVISVVGNSFEVFVREGELSHGCRPWCRLILLPRCRV